MNVLLASFLFLGLCCFESGYAKSNTECAAHMNAFPPEIGTGCCGDDLLGFKHIESRETALYQYPWTAIIEYIPNHIRDKKRFDLCGGALISGRFVLTAAQCITGPILSTVVPTTIRLGDYYRTTDGPDCVVVGPNIEECTDGETRIQIDRTIPHPLYKPNDTSRANDIGLIRMKETAPYTDFIRPICLPTEDVTLKTGPLNFIFAGWGTLHGPGRVKLHLNLPFVPKDQCQTALLAVNPNVQIDDDRICAGGVKGEDSCTGDGGLPLIYETDGKYVVAGIVSFGSVPCGIENVPSVYTNVYKYNSYLQYLLFYGGSNIIS